MWHRHPDSSDDAMMPASWPVTLSRDDLIRLVVGMQWREAIAVFEYRDHHSIDGSWWLPSDTDASHIDLRPACDIVDEWLGVQK